MSRIEIDTLNVSFSISTYYLFLLNRSTNLDLSNITVENSIFSGFMFITSNFQQDTSTDKAYI